MRAFLPWCLVLGCSVFRQDGKEANDNKVGFPGTCFKKARLTPWFFCGVGFFYTSESQVLQKNRGGPNIRDDGSGPA